MKKQRRIPILKITKRRDKDPNQCLSVVVAWDREVKKRFNNLKQKIYQYIVKNNKLGGKTPTLKSDVTALASNGYVYEYSNDQLKSFNSWLDTQVKAGILETEQRPFAGLTSSNSVWCDTYIQSAYQKGIAQARADLNAGGAKLLDLGPVHAAFNKPIHADRVGLMYTRSFNGMAGVTEAMKSQMSNVLASSMAEGRSPYDIAYKLNDRVDKIGMTRSRLIARTEVTYTHNQATLNEFASLEGVVGEDILVQWWTALDERVRSSHRLLHAVVMTREEVQQYLGDPNCRCTLLPWTQTLSDAREGRLEKSGQLEAAQEEVDAYTPGWELDGVTEDSSIGNGIAGEESLGVSEASLDEMIAADPVTQSFMQGSLDEETKKALCEQYFDSKKYWSEAFNDAELLNNVDKYSMGNSGDERSRYIRNKIETLSSNRKIPASTIGPEKDFSFRGMKDIANEWQHGTYTETAQVLKLYTLRAEQSLSTFTRVEIERADIILNNSISTLRDYVEIRAMNQVWMSDVLGIKDVTLYRGIHGSFSEDFVSELKVVKESGATKALFKDDNISGWSASSIMADEYGVGSQGATLARKLPVSDVIIHEDLLCGLTGNLFSEREFICMGGNYYLPIAGIKY